MKFYEELLNFYYKHNKKKTNIINYECENFNKNTLEMDIFPEIYKKIIESIKLKWNIHIAYILDNLYNFSCFNILINKLNLDLLRCIILKMISDIRDRKLYYYNRQCFIFYPCFLS